MTSLTAFVADTAVVVEDFKHQGRAQKPLNLQARVDQAPADGQSAASPLRF